MSEDSVSAPEEPAEQHGETLGRRLRTARESRELSIEKIADELRIEGHILFALEEDRLSDIAVAPVFIKGYIKQYARLLELDYEELREAFRRQTDTEDVHLLPNKAIHLRDERQITIWIIAALAVLLVAVALFVWWLGAEEGTDLNPFSDVGEPDGVSVAEPAVAPAVRVPPQEPLVQARDEPAEATSVAAADSGLLESAQEAAAAREQRAESAAAGDEAVQVPAPVPVEPEPGSVAMRFAFSDESWFELTDARGRRLYYDLADPGSSVSLNVLPPARVVVGNAAAVEITVASEPYEVPRASLRGNVASFVIDPAQD